jgi:hypothetical protein
LAVLTKIDLKKIETEIRNAAKAKKASTPPKLRNISDDGIAAARKKKQKLSAGICQVCGCTDLDCSQCIKKTGKPCHWVDKKHTLCSACADNPRFHGMKQTAKKASKSRIPEEDRAIAVSTD